VSLGLITPIRPRIVSVNERGAVAGGKVRPILTKSPDFSSYSFFDKEASTRLKTSLNVFSALPVFTKLSVMESGTATIIIDPHVDW
jgi:hypothetical protein